MEFDVASNTGMWPSGHRRPDERRLVLYGVSAWICLLIVGMGTIAGRLAYGRRIEDGPLEAASTLTVMSGLYLLRKASKLRQGTAQPLLAEGVFTAVCAISAAIALFAYSVGSNAVLFMPALVMCVVIVAQFGDRAMKAISATVSLALVSWTYHHQGVSAPVYLTELST